jgi:type I restriction-modification system DNA methylase subunit
MPDQQLSNTATPRGAAMVLKKSDLYSSLWRSCDELRGGMDASQYKDYILTLLFVKYVSDKAKADRTSLIDVPPGGSFDDMLAAKGSPEIGDRFNKLSPAWPRLTTCRRSSTSPTLTTKRSSAVARRCRTG